MRKLLILVAVLVVIAAGYALWWSQPLLALRQLKIALVSRDEDRVATLVDFAALRVNVLKHTDHKIDVANQDEFLGGLRRSIEKDLAEGKIETLTTPEGLIHVVCDKKPDGSVDTSPQPRDKPCPVHGELRNPHYLESSRFIVGIHKQSGADLRLTLARGDDGWKLVDLADAAPATN